MHRKKETRRFEFKVELSAPNEAVAFDVCGLALILAPVGTQSVTVHGWKVF